VDIVDSVLFFNSDFLSPNSTESAFFSATYYLKRDKRNNKSYPTQGFFYDFQLTQNGLGVLDKEINNSFLRLGYRKFIKLFHKTYWAGLVKGKVSFSDVPYGLLGGLGYQNQLVRGYEYYVVNGNHFGLFKTQLRYGLVEEKIFRIKPLPFDKFNKVPISIYLGAYFDAGYVSENKTTNSPNFLNNDWLYGGGASIDFVSYYDMVFRLEYSVNRLNEQGLFIHFIAPL
jgi:outer membrane protein assembly factor BamA